MKQSLCNVLQVVKVLHGTVGFRASSQRHAWLKEVSELPYTHFPEEAQRVKRCKASVSFGEARGTIQTMRLEWIPSGEP